MTYCEKEIQMIPSIFFILGIIQTLSFVFCVGMASSCIQKLSILRFKDNVSIDAGIFFVEVAGLCISLLLILNFQNVGENTLVSGKCA